MELTLLDSAIRVVGRQHEELRDALSVAVAELCLSQQKQILMAKRDAALALAAASDAESRLISEIIQSGHNHCPGVMRSPPLDTAVRLGSTAEYNSPISEYLRVLREIGVNG
jgi:hypothetical protein